MQFRSNTRISSVDDDFSAAFLILPYSGIHTRLKQEDRSCMDENTLLRKTGRRANYIVGVASFMNNCVLC